jgi:predicted tellurium resistance membrane protein TerC
MFGIFTAISRPSKTFVRDEWLEKTHILTIVGIEGIIIGIMGAILLILGLFISDNTVKNLIKELRTISYYDLGLLSGIGLVVLVLNYMTIYFLRHEMGYVIKLMLVFEVIVIGILTWWEG